MRCKNCGSEIADNAEMCLYCGEIFTSGNKATQTTLPNNISDPQNSKPIEETSDKSRIAGGLLGLFLGGLGVHNFYLGRYKRGALQLSLTILSVILCVVGTFLIVSSLINSGVDVETLTDEELTQLVADSIYKYTVYFLIPQIVSSVVGIWAFVESILILCGITKDKHGRPLK